ncbi:class I SAM-dependent methyltransferase [Candidatus Woesearchaeota archaeon]|nr:class I SAM-dependent methyltransferase [Candidatus Woesearchaeota archaeon]
MLETICEYLEQERQRIRITKLRHHKDAHVIQSTDVCEIRKEMQAYYDESAYEHDAHVVHTTRELLIHSLWQYLQENPSIQKIADGGCGTGVDIAFLAKQFPEKKFIGYDLAHANLKIARERIRRLNLKNVFLVQATHERLPLTDLDMIYCIGSLDNEQQFSQEHPETQEFQKLRDEIIQSFTEQLRIGGVLATTIRCWPLRESEVYAKDQTKDPKYEEILNALHFDLGSDRPYFTVSHWNYYTGDEDFSYVLTFSEKLEKPHMLQLLSQCLM